LLSNKLYRPLRYRFSNGQQLANLLEMFFPDDKPLPKLTEASKQAWTLNALAQAYQMTGQPGRAVPLFERSNQHKEKASYTVDLSSGLRDLAYAQRLVGGLRYSEVAARRALLIDRREENRLLEAISLQVLGLALAARGRYDESEKALDRSLDLADRTNANRAYNHQAMRALWFGDHSSAMDWSDKGIIYCKQRKLEAGLILANRLQGEAALGLKDLKLAEERLTYAIAEARAVIFVEEELAALIALAELRRQQGDLDTARALLEDVWHAAEHGPYRLFHADACNVLAYIERDAGNNDAAVQAALKAFSFSWCDGPPYAYHRGLMQAQTHLGVLDQPEPELEPFDPDDTMPMVAVDIDPKGETA
jgi:tetratricopeptide (TPR) repeat protein